MQAKISQLLGKFTNKSTNDLTSCVRTCSKFSTSLEQPVNNL